MTFREVQDVVVTYLGVEPGQVEMNTDLRYDLGADAIDMIDMFLVMRSRYGIRVPFEKGMKVGTVRQLCELTA